MSFTRIHLLFGTGSIWWTVSCNKNLFFLFFCRVLFSCKYLRSVTSCYAFSALICRNQTKSIANKRFFCREKKRFRWEKKVLNSISRCDEKWLPKVKWNRPKHKVSRARLIQMVGDYPKTIRMCGGDWKPYQKLASEIMVRQIIFNERRSFRKVIFCFCSFFWFSWKWPTDLTGSTFTAGRLKDSSCCFSASLSNKLLLQTSKTHFKLTKDLNMPTNPVYIEVSGWFSFFFSLFFRLSCNDGLSLPLFSKGLLA